MISETASSTSPTILSNSVVGEKVGARVGTNSIGPSAVGGSVVSLVGCSVVSMVGGGMGALVGLGIGAMLNIGRVGSGVGCGVTGGMVSRVIVEGRGVVGVEGLAVVGGLVGPGWKIGSSNSLGASVS